MMNVKRSRRLQGRLIDGFQYTSKYKDTFQPTSGKTERWRLHAPKNMQTTPNLHFRSLLLSAAPVEPIIPILSTELNIAIFVIGLVPFIWATIEFWRRIAFGEPFGTTKDSVIIGEDMKPSSSRGRRILGQGAIAVAYLLFGIAAFILVISLYSVTSTNPTGLNI